MPPFLTQPHLANYLLIKRLLDPNNPHEVLERDIRQEAAEPEPPERVDTFSTTMASPTLAGPTTTTISTLVKFEHAGEEFIEKVAEKTHVPFWGVFLILLVILAVILVVFYCCLQRWWRKIRGKEGGKGFFGGGKVDLKSVQLLGQAYKEKVMEIY